MLKFFTLIIGIFIALIFHTPVADTIESPQDATMYKETRENSNTHTQPGSTVPSQGSTTSPAVSIDFSQLNPQNVISYVGSVLTDSTTIVGNNVHTTPEPSTAALPETISVDSISIPSIESSQIQVANTSNPVLVGYATETSPIVTLPTNLNSGDSLGSRSGYVYNVSTPVYRPTNQISQTQSTSTEPVPTGPLVTYTDTPSTTSVVIASTSTTATSSATLLATPVIPEAVPLLTEAQINAVASGTYFPSNNAVAQLGTTTATSSPQMVTDTTPSSNPLLRARTQYSSRSIIPAPGNFVGNATKVEGQDEIQLDIDAKSTQDLNLHTITVRYTMRGTSNELTYGVYDNNGLIIEDLDGCKYMDTSGRPAQLPPIPDLAANRTGDYNIYHWVDAQRSCPALGSYPVRLGFRIFESATEINTVMDIYRGDQRVGQNGYVFGVGSGTTPDSIRRSYTSYEHDTEYVYRYFQQ